MKSNAASASKDMSFTGASKRSKLQTSPEETVASLGGALVLVTMASINDARMAEQTIAERTHDPATRDAAIKDTFDLLTLPIISADPITPTATQQLRTLAEAQGRRV